MTVYHVKTQEAYDELMSELEEKGCEWFGGEKPTLRNNFKEYDEDTHIYDECSIISFSDGYYFKKYCSDEPAIEYKAKGENMTIYDTETQKDRDELIIELEKFKSSAKKLIEKIDECLETLKPEFKVGDYVTLDIPNKKIVKVDRLNGDALHGLWYSTESKNIEQDFYFGSGIGIRNATPTEIAEYKVALTFHNNGRNPFELKRGDIVYLKGYDKNIFLDSGNIYKKHNFVNGDAILVKTVEEVNEWLENK